MQRFSRVLFLALVTLIAASPTPHAISPDVVISQVYGGGGNTGATFTNDFIELYNRGSAPVDVTGWTVQYTSASGTSWQATALSGTVQPRQVLPGTGSDRQRRYDALADPGCCGLDFDERHCRKSGARPDRRPALRGMPQRR